MNSGSDSDDPRDPRDDDSDVSEAEAADEEALIERRGNVVIQRVERQMDRVTRRYVLLVLSESRELLPVTELTSRLAGLRPNAKIASRSAGDNGGTPASFDGGVRVLLELEGAEVGIDSYPFVDCPWFEKDAPEGDWQQVYELFGDVALQDKEKDERFRDLVAVAHSLAEASGGSLFDLQEWRLLAPFTN